MGTVKRLDPLAGACDERRDFLKKIAIAAAFAAPTVATFSLDGVRKKAFAQSVYGRPVVLSLLSTGKPGQAVVTFSQPMDTGVGSGADLSRTGAPRCREHSLSVYNNAHTYSGVWNWDGNTTQVFSVLDSCPDEDILLSVSYNQSSCAEKFRGTNGLELVPWSGSITISGYCSNGA